MSPQVVYQDKDLLALAKPFGMPSQRDPSGSESLHDWATQHLGREPHLLHRLDRPTGGLILLGVSKRGTRELSRQFAERQVAKVYLAVVKDRPEFEEVELSHYIGKLPGKNFVRAYDNPVRGSKAAHLWARVLCSKGGRTLLEVHPKTGRRHQIRAQLRTVKCSILGDLKYGKGNALDYPGIALWAHSVRIALPGGEEKTLTVEPPNLFPWSEFRGE